MGEIGYLTALLGGLLSLLSPCSALLLPAFFAYAFTTPTRLLTRTAAFFLGLCLTLVPLGVAGSYAGRLFYGHRDLLVQVGGWSLIALGLAQVLGLGFGSRWMQQAAGRSRPSSVGSVLFLGSVYGFAGFCAGPILGGILTLSALRGSPVYGGALLAVYAFGMAAPLFLLAAAWDRFQLGHRRWLRGRAVRLGGFEAHSTSLLSGGMFVALGVIFLRFQGGSGLSGPLGVDQEARLEEWVRDLGSAVPDLSVLLVMGLVLGGGLLLRLRRPTGGGAPEDAAQGRAPEPPAGTAPSKAGTEEAGTRPTTQP